MIEVLEGRICALAALQAGRRKIEALLVKQGIRDDTIRDLLDAAATRGVPVRKVREEALDAQAHGKTHGGVLAIAEPLPPSTLPASLNFALLLDGVDDGRNLGYAIRSAEAFGVQAVILRRRAWDFDGGDVSRASSGAFERLPVVIGDEVPPGLVLIGCMAGAGKTIYDEDFTRPLVLAIGGEKRGLSAALRDRCASRVSIPTREGAPSLSLTHAAAVVMAEVARQRRAKMKV
ncbi:MAG TPA: RNA methyltransferase [Planctomycetota bacterium]|nr:RNA methyltransferase [Planctomycetota bacterium]